MSSKLALRTERVINSYEAVKKIKYLEKCNKQNMTRKAFEIYNNLHQTQKNEFVISALLNCCKKVLKKQRNDMDTMEIIHNIKSSIINTNDNVYAKNTLIDIYGKIGDIDNAAQIFNNIPEYKKDVVSINAMMTAYNSNAKHNKSILLYEQFSKYDDKLNDTSNLLFIKACINIADYDKAKKLIDLKIKDLNNRSIEFINTLIDFYGKVGDIKNASKVFNNIPENKRNIVSVGIMMNAYNKNREFGKTISLYEQYNDKHDDISNLLFIKACSNIGDYDKGKKLLNGSMKHVNNHSIEFITTLIDFYGKSGDIKSAIKIFNDIPHNKKNVVSVGAMMKSFIDNNENQNAISLYEQYNNDFQHDDTSNLLLIKACNNIGAYDKGKKLISSMTKDINKHSIEFINTLIDFHGKIGDIDSASKVFNDIPHNKKNTVSINVMMTAYNNNAEYNKSISLYKQYKDKHNDVSNVLFIKACSNITDYDKAKGLIDLNIENIENINNHSIEFINTLIDFYGKSGDIKNALKIFNNIPGNKKDIVSINAMMNAYNNNEQYNQAMSLYEQYCGQHNDKHNDISDTLYIKACINIGDYHKGKKLINLNVQDIKSRSIEFLTTLIDFYGKFGDIKNALKVFNDIAEDKRNIVSINAMMTAYNNNEKYDECILLYEQYNDKHNDISNTLFINACCNIGYYDKGKRFINSQTKDTNSYSIEFITTLIDFYGKSGDIKSALNIFNHVLENKKDIVLISAMMNAYSNNEEYNKTISLYEQYNGEHNDASNLLFIKACKIVGDYDKEKKIIDSIMRDINKHSIEFVNTLVNFYGEIGDIKTARKVFNKISENKKNIVSIGAMMNAYNKNEEYYQTISLYEQYNNGELEHNDISNTLFINACGSIGEDDKGKEMINSLSIKDINNHSIEFINTVINFYGKSGDIDVASNVFSNIPESNKTVASIGAMMNAYNDNEQYNKALNLFNEIKIEKNEYIYCMALFAAGNLVSSNQGSIIIDDLNKIENHNTLQSLYIQSAIITYYAKCNNFEEAIQIFNDIIKLKHKDKNGLLHLYGAIMDCYAKSGNSKQLLSLFNHLKNDREINITKDIYSIVINGCSHSGLIDDALAIFNEIKTNKKYNTNPQIITAVIDCLGRKGHLTDAENLYIIYIENNKIIHDKLKLPALFSLLSSCRIHNDETLGQRIFDKTKIISNDIDNETLLRPYQHWLNNRIDK